MALSPDSQDGGPELTGYKLICTEKLDSLMNEKNNFSR